MEWAGTRGLAILEGVQDVYDTPFFNNLKKYRSGRSVLPRAANRARESIFKSDWIRDMGEFYGPTLFLAESSVVLAGGARGSGMLPELRKGRLQRYRCLFSGAVFPVLTRTVDTDLFRHRYLSCYDGLGGRT